MFPTDFDYSLSESDLDYSLSVSRDMYSDLIKNVKRERCVPARTASVRPNRPGRSVHGERANFAVLVLFCIDASDCESRRIF